MHSSVAADTDDEASFRKARKEAIQYFTADSRRCLAENLDDWADHYEQYQIRLNAILAPNPSLNADVPHAGLRPRNGPPVS